MQSKSEFSRDSGRVRSDFNDTKSVDNIKLEWKWVENTIKQEEKEIKQVEQYRQRIEGYIQHAETKEKETQETILAIKNEYNKVLASDTIHFFNPSYFPADPSLDSIMTHAFSGGVRTMRALQQLQYITINGELDEAAPGVFQKAFEDYVGKKIKTQEKNSWFWGWG